MPTLRAIIVGMMLFFTCLCVTTFLWLHSFDQASFTTPTRQMHFSPTTRKGDAQHQEEESSDWTWGQRAFAQIDQPAICYASLEWKCFSSNAGGLGRAFLAQTAAMIRGGEFPIRALFLHYQEGQLEPEMLCPDDEDAVAVAPFLAAPDVPMQWFKGMQVTYPPTLLLEWLRLHPKACKILHVADWNGLGALVTLAVKTGLPQFQHLHINVQAHGPDFQISLEGLVEDRLMSDGFRHAQERLAYEHADSVAFLNQESENNIKALSRVSPNTFIIPNIVSPLPQSMISRLPNGDRVTTIKPRLVIFYGKINSRKGFNLFIKSILQVPKELLFGLQIAIVGPMLMSNETVTRALDIVRNYTMGTSPVKVYHSWNRLEVIDFFISHAHEALVILPSYFEVQSFALFDILQSGIPFLATNISAHRAQISLELHSLLLTSPDHHSLADKLTTVITNGIDWQPKYHLVPYDAEDLWRKWHHRIFFSHTNRKLAAIQQLEADVEGLPEVSIVITVCDRTKYINSAIKSILNQTYPQHLIHVYFAASCPRSVPCIGIRNWTPSLSLFVNAPQCWNSDSPRTSLGRARNEATARTKTELVVFLDDDDELPTFAVENYVRAARLNPDRAIFTSYADLFVQDLDAPITDAPKNRSARWAMLGAVPEAGLLVNGLGGANMMVNRSSEFWKISDGFTDILGVGCEDWELLAKASLVEGVMLVPEVGLWYRRVLVNGKMSGMLAENEAKESYIACRLRVLRGALNFADHPLMRIRHHRLLFSLHYALAMYEKHEKERWP